MSTGAFLAPFRWEVRDPLTDLPAAGAKLYSYLSGTSTPQALYAEQGLLTPWTNPVVADAHGTFPVMYLANVAYRILITSATGATIYAAQDGIDDTWGIFAGTAQTANTVFAGPSSGASAAPTFRAVVQPDLPVATMDVGRCEGRLTLTTGTPVTVGDVTAATSIFFTPYRGNRVALFDGSLWAAYVYTERSIAVPSTSSQVYDVFLYNNSGTLTLELTAWTNDTTRATGLVVQDGVYVKSGALTRRYLGTFSTTAVSGQTEDSTANRLVYNYAQRVDRPFLRQETTDTWTYTTATFRQANNSAANQVTLVNGVSEEAVDLRLVAQAANSSASIQVTVAIGEDSTTAKAAACVNGFETTSNAGNTISMMSASLVKIPGLGRHVYTWLEYSTATGTTTWYGDGAVATLQSGMVGTWRA